ncbi:unnamed protein product [Amoebophrya sp. A120]|nr:unnamed protein product [Amoebophrya sp. A120]|eukprot:GSA120T00003994001.1
MHISARHLQRAQQLLLPLRLPLVREARRVRAGLPVAAVQVDRVHAGRVPHLFAVPKSEVLLPPETGAGRRGVRRLDLRLRLRPGRREVREAVRPGRRERHGLHGQGHSRQFRGRNRGLRVRGDGRVPFRAPDVPRRSGEVRERGLPRHGRQSRHSVQLARAVPEGRDRDGPLQRRGARGRDDARLDQRDGLLPAAVRGPRFVPDAVRGAHKLAHFVFRGVVHDEKFAPLPRRVGSESDRLLRAGAAAG